MGGCGAALCPPEPVSCLCLSRVHAERDAFDTLFDHAPDKLSVVKKVSSCLECFAASPGFFTACAPCWEEGGEMFEISEMFATWIEV